MERDKLEQKLWDIRISRDSVEMLEVLAEFDRLKLKVAEPEGKLWDAQDEPRQPEWDDHCQKCIRYNDCECEPEELSYCPAEFDRLNEIITNQSSLINNMAEREAKLQSQLDKISEPYHYSRDKAEYPWIRHEGKADGCPMCDPKCEH